MWEVWVPSLGREDPLEKEMATHSSILAWRISWTEEPVGLQSTGSQRVRHDWATSLSFFLFWQEYTEELYKKDLHDPDNHNGVITHLEPDILECEVKWASGSITTNKASGGDGISAKLFQVLLDDAVKVLHSICHQIWKTQQWPQDWKSSVFILIPNKGNAKECLNYHTTALISHASQVMLKILQARLQQYMKQEIPDFQAGFRKERRTRDQIAKSVVS